MGEKNPNRYMLSSSRSCSQTPSHVRRLTPERTMLNSCYLTPCIWFLSDPVTLQPIRTITTPSSALTASNELEPETRRSRVSSVLPLSLFGLLFFLQSGAHALPFHPSERRKDVSRASMHNTILFLRTEPNLDYDFQPWLHGVLIWLPHVQGSLSKQHKGKS